MFIEIHSACDAFSSVEADEIFFNFLLFFQICVNNNERLVGVWKLLYVCRAAT